MTLHCADKNRGVKYLHHPNFSVVVLKSDMDYLIHNNRGTLRKPPHQVLEHSKNTNPAPNLYN
ncbi:hypothetical protein [Mucilaginibacter sp. SP1R1]|uniref:hypothetical protein n=1 Tax=Mucilaginibacter sp. SP1R1 TaxID=2723091 RepID=UPI00161E4E92|nr:hypothetical protein [Mucilaginibacter sp. SP1R1]MBB6147523.1 hypothetical protein [Mucilaginibacter sp. SP1R1]